MAVVPSSPNSPTTCAHLIQAYSDDAFLARVVSGYVAEGLVRGEGAVVVATPAHERLVTERLDAAGVDVADAVGAGQMLLLDAERTLSRFLVDGRPDRTTFLAVVAAALDHVRTAGYQAIRIYGEMVDLLWPRDVEATLELEGLWNEAQETERFALLCAYGLDPLDRHAKGILRQVTHRHSQLLPADDPERLEDAVDRAYAEVFGVSGDVAALRELMASRHARGPAVSSAHAALFALDDMPPLIANDIGTRARQYYRAARGAA
jgi:MEDS: MEthanogen/methylotroph, DcmR Sensory domain